MSGAKLSRAKSFFLRGSLNKCFEGVRLLEYQNAEVRRQKSEGRNQKSEIGRKPASARGLSIAIYCRYPRPTNRQYVPNVNIAVLQIGLGQKDAASESLERAAAEKDSWMTFLKVEPIWFELSDDPSIPEARPVDAFAVDIRVDADNSGSDLIRVIRVNPRQITEKPEVVSGPRPSSDKVMEPGLRYIGDLRFRSDILCYFQSIVPSHKIAK